MGLGVGGSCEMICISFERSSLVVWKMLHGRRVERRVNRNRPMLPWLRREKTVLAHVLLRRATEAGLNVLGFH